MDEQQMSRLLDALENVASQLERLRLLKEYELGVRVEHQGGDPTASRRAPRSRITYRAGVNLRVSPGR